MSRPVLTLKADARGVVRKISPTKPPPPPVAKAVAAAVQPPEKAIEASKPATVPTVLPPAAPELAAPKQPSKREQREAQQRKIWQATYNASLLHFYCVWGEDSPAPRKRHETREGAVGEAQRLSELHPGTSFLVFECRLTDERKVEKAARELGIEKVQPTSFPV